MINYRFIDNYSNFNINVAVVISFIIFLVSPSLGCIICIFLSFLSNDKRLVPICFIILWLLVILIQSQRIVKLGESGDWQNYNRIFNALSWGQLLNSNSLNDVGFSIWNLLCKDILGLNFIQYADFTVDIGLLFYGFATYNIWLSTGKDARYGICALCLVFMLSEIQLISNNLLRQQFAFSLFILGTVLKYRTIRYWYIFVLWGVLTHSMVLIFVPMLFISLNKRYSTKSIAIIILLLIFIFCCYTILQPLLLNSSIYIFQRIGSGENYIDNDVIEPTVVFIFASIVFIIYFKHVIIDKCRNEAIWYGLNSMAYIIILCLCTISMPLITTRIYIARLPLISWVIPYVFIKRNVENTVFQFCVMAFFIYRFILKTQNEYLDISEIAKYSLIDFL